MNPAVFVLSMLAAPAGQQRPIEPDLAKLVVDHRLQVVNRTATVLVDGSRKGLQLSATPGDGVAFLQGVEFAKGTIEIDIRGKDVQGQSFVGVAFHGLNDSTYDAVYFRPFNFRVADSTRHAHAVQYIAHPTYTWNKLRAEHPGAYERAVNPVPDPNGWFHARIVVHDSTVSVWVDGGTEPSLIVRQLSDRGHGMVGLWVGNTSGGDFANLRIVPQ